MWVLSGFKTHKVLLDFINFASPSIQWSIFVSFRLITVFITKTDFRYKCYNNTDKSGINYHGNVCLARWGSYAIRLLVRWKSSDLPNEPTGTLVKTNRATQTTYGPPSSVGRHIAIQEGCRGGIPCHYFVKTRLPRGIVVQQVRAVS